MPIKVTLHDLRGADDQQREFAEQAVTLLTKALNHPEFETLVRATSYSTAFQDSRGRRSRLPNQRVWAILASGIELGTASDLEIDLRVRLKWLWRPSTMGWTNVGGPVIVTNTRYFNRWMRDADPAYLAAHWLHEWLHVAGFVHEDGHEDDDAPYVVGELVYGFIHERLST